MKRYLATIALILASAAGIASASQDATPAVSVNNSPRVCYSAKHWSPDPQRERPCVRVSRLYEDGSFQFEVSDADGTVRYTSGVGAQDR